MNVFRAIEAAEDYEEIVDRLLRDTVLPSLQNHVTYQIQAKDPKMRLAWETVLNAHGFPPMEIPMIKAFRSRVRTLEVDTEIYIASVVPVPDLVC